MEEIKENYTIAMALVGDAKIIFLDEPSSSKKLIFLLIYLFI